MGPLTLFGALSRLQCFLAKIFGMTGVKVNLSVMFDVENAETWGKAFNVTDEDEQRRIARKYAGLQFFNSMDDVPESLKDHCVPVEENGVKGYVHLCLYPKC